MVVGRVGEEEEEVGGREREREEPTRSHECAGRRRQTPSIHGLQSRQQVSLASLFYCIFALIDVCMCGDRSFADVDCEIH